MADIGGIADAGAADFCDEADLASAAMALASGKDLRHRKWVARSRKAAQRRSDGARQVVGARAASANERAVRAGDIIDLESHHERRRRLGRGGHRRWTARAMLLNSFGKVKKRSQKDVNRLLKRKRRRPKAAVTASTRASADHVDAGHSHLQSVRNTVAQKLVTAVERGVREILERGPELCVLDVRFDETHFEMKLPRETYANFDATLYENGHFPLVMIKATLSWWFGGGFPEESAELLVPPAVLSECCSAESLWAALRHALPTTWDELARHCKLVVLLLSHDSHAGNLRLVRGICESAPPNVLVLSSRCAMHQLQLVLSATYIHRAITFHSELFCMCKLLHHGVYMRKLRAHMHCVLDERFRVVYTPTNPDDLAWSSKFAHLMFVGSAPDDEDDDPEQQDSALRKRVAACQAVCKIFNGRWLDSTGPILHRCNMECDCLNEADSLVRAHEQLDSFILKNLPEEATMNKWTKYQPPARKIGLACGFHGVFQEAFRRLMSQVKDEDEGGFWDFLRHVNRGLGDGGDVAAAAPEPEAFQRVKRTRFMYAGNFVRGVASLWKITVTMQIVGLVDQLVKRFFEQSADDLLYLYEWRGSPMVDLANLEESPAMACISAHMDALDDVSSTAVESFWFIAFSVPGMELQDKQRLVLSLVLRQVGQIWHRLVFYYQLPPWNLAALTDPRLPPESRRSVSSTFCSGLECCTGVASRSLQGLFPDEEAFQSSLCQRVLRTMFSRARSQTIAVEERFKRSRVHTATSSGNPQSIATICSNHVLSEAFSLHNQLRDATGGARSVGPAKVPGRKLSGWNLYLAEQNRKQTGSSLQSTSVSSAAGWRSLDRSQKLKYTEQARRDSVKKAARCAKVNREQAESYESHCRNMALRSLWGMGDQDFPYAAQALQHDMDEARARGVNLVSEFALAWRAAHEEPVIADALDPFPADVSPDNPSCWEVYGVGRCQFDLSIDARAAMSEYDEVIDSIIRNVETVDSESAPLLWMEAVGLDGALAGRLLVLLIVKIGNPITQVYARCELKAEGPPQTADAYVGSPVDIHLMVERIGRWRLPRMLLTSHLACMMATDVPLGVTWSWAWQPYSVADGTTFHVDAINPLVPFERQVREDIGDALAATALRSLRPPPVAPKRPRPKRVRLFAGFARRPDRGAVEGDGEEQVEVGESKEEDDVDDEEDDVDDAPRLDPQVVDPLGGAGGLCTTVVKDADGMRLGSITVLPGGGNILCICYLHKCRHLVSATDVPNTEVIKLWLHQGKGITARRHLGMFWDTIRAEKTDAPRPLAPQVDAAASPCPPPPPHPSQAEQVRGRRGARLIGTFGPFRINELASYDKASGLFRRTGLSIICGRHTDRDGDQNACSSDCTFGNTALDEADVLRRMKRWALKGYMIDEQQTGPRSLHMRGFGPARRCVEPLTIEERAAIPVEVFKSGELVGL